VGDLAEATGLTVRTLHYYEEIGLLIASERSDGGHRLYADADVERLYRICVLRRLGFELSEIGSVLDDPAWHLPVAVDRHLEQLERRLELEGRLRWRLQQLQASVGDGAGGARSDPDQLIQLLEDMSMLEPTLERRISILVYADLEAAYEHHRRVFALGPGELTRDESGEVVHGELQAGDGVIWLHRESEEFGLASPLSLGAATASISVIVDDVDQHHAHASENGAQIVYPPTDMPYGYREYGASDCEGHLWSFMRPLDQR
jgi:DNA-binding transcriptional MerR regulator